MSKVFKLPKGPKFIDPPPEFGRTELCTECDTGEIALWIALGTKSKTNAMRQAKRIVGVLNKSGLIQ